MACTFGKQEREQISVGCKNLRVQSLLRSSETLAGPNPKNANHYSEIGRSVAKKTLPLQQTSTIATAIAALLQTTTATAAPAAVAAAATAACFLACLLACLLICHNQLHPPLAAQEPACARAKNLTKLTGDPGQHRNMTAYPSTVICWNYVALLEMLLTLSVLKPSSWTRPRQGI